PPLPRTPREPPTDLPMFEMPDDMRWTPDEVAPNAWSPVESTGPGYRSPPRPIDPADVPPLPTNSKDPFSVQAAPEMSEMEGEPNQGLELFVDQPGHEWMAGADSGLDSDQSAEDREMAEPEILEDLLGLPAPASKSGVVSTGDDLLKIDLPDYAVHVDTDRENPLADDPEAPLRIEGISPNLDLKDVFSIRCPVCESWLTIPNHQSGTKVQCPDCLSHVEAVKPVETKSPNPWSMGSRHPFGGGDIDMEVHRTEADLFGEGELKLSEPVGRDDLAAPPVLPPVAEDLLRPRAPLPPPSSPAERARWKTTAEARAEEARREQTAQEQANAYRPGRWAEQKPRTGEPSMSPPDKTADHRVPGQANLDMLDISFANYGFSPQVMMAWVAAFFRGKEMWFRYGGCVVVLGLGWWCLSVVRDIMFGEEPVAPQLVVLVGCALLGSVLGFAGLVLVSMTCAQVYERAVERKPGFDADPGWGWQDWGAGFQYLLVGVFVGGLPGAFLGTFLWLASGSFLVLSACWTLSAMLLGPLVLANSYFNSSPFYIVAPAVLKLYRGDNLDWLKYLLPALVCWLVAFVGLLLADVGGLLFSVVGALVWVFAWVAFMALMGLYCALIADKAEELP
ncbi:MAG TPA: MFS transporter, partial [Pirellulaceae bacterium]|nr:MFS transporter [Pirellulaceae bacterium]